jgi:hypothetical protein
MKYRLLRSPLTFPFAAALLALAILALSFAAPAQAQSDAAPPVPGPGQTNLVLSSHTKVVITHQGATPGTCLQYLSEPCDTYSVTIPFKIIPNTDAAADFQNSPLLAIMFAPSGYCPNASGSPTFETHLYPTKMFTMKGGKYTGVAGSFDYTTFAAPNAWVSTSLTYGKSAGLLKATGQGDFSALTSGAITVAVIPFFESDPDDSSGINAGDLNCVVVTPTYKTMGF